MGKICTSTSIQQNQSRANKQEENANFDMVNAD